MPSDKAALAFTISPWTNRKKKRIHATRAHIRPLLFIPDGYMSFLNGASRTKGNRRSLLLAFEEN